EAITFTVEAAAKLPIPTAVWLPDEGTGVRDAAKGERSVYVGEAGGYEPVTVYDAERLRPGNELDGPAVIEADDTTVFVHPGQHLVVDGLLNLRIDLSGRPGRPSGLRCRCTVRSRRLWRQPAPPKSSATATSGRPTTDCRGTSSLSSQRSPSRRGSCSWAP